MASDDAPPAQYWQGVVEAWNSSTGENTIRVAGGVLVNLPALTGESAELTTDDVVVLVSAGGRWLVLGKATSPGDAGTVPTWSADIEALTGQVAAAQATADTAASDAAAAATAAAAAQSGVDDLAGGRTGITTDASGRAAITHGMGATPAWVVLTSENTGTYWLSLVSRTSTTFTVQVNSKDAGVLVSSAFTVHWFAGLH